MIKRSDPRGPYSPAGNPYRPAPAFSKPHFGPANTNNVKSSKPGMGLSKSTKNMLIIGLVIFSIIMIWIVARALIKEKPVEVTPVDSFAADLQISQVEILNYTDINLDVGEGRVDGKLDSVTFSFYNEEGSKILTKRIPIKQLEDNNFEITLRTANTSDIKSISITPTFVDSNGGKVVGDTGGEYVVAEEEKYKGELPGVTPSCTSDTQCNDNNSCTTNSCVDGECNYLDIINCIPCVSNSECDDSNSCTTNLCSQGRCSYLLIPGCSPCLGPYNCDDGNSCTNNICIQGRCLYTDILGCKNCTLTSECEDNDVCTTNNCLDGACSFDQISDCKSCTSVVQCNDSDVCTTDSCSGNKCVYFQVTSCKNNDGCCIMGCTFTNDNDCSYNPVCGNGIKEGSEQCDGDSFGGETCASIRGSSYTGTLRCSNICAFDTSLCAIPCTCPSDNDACTTDVCVNNVCQHILTSGCKSCSTVAQCNDNILCTTDSCISNKCVNSQITSCISNDGCCPSGCTFVNDNNCVQCTAANQATCNDNSLCTADSCATNGTCMHNQINSCVSGDGCCPNGCTSSNDNDCPSSLTCGNGIREGNEKCDGNNLGGASCTGVLGAGYTGTLGCLSSCTFDTSLCVAACVAETNTAFCSRLARNCGSFTGTDNCGTQRTVTNCGSCTSPKTCQSGICFCNAETNAAFCSRLGKTCGSVTANDNCGTTRTISCGSCTTGQSCNNNVCTTPNCIPNCAGKTCGSDGCSGSCGTCNSPQTCTNGVCTGSTCTAETNAAFCSRLGKNCGSFTGIDNCGTSRTISCGNCATGQTCTNNICTNPTCTAETNAAFCSRLGKNCGSFTGIDNCGTSRTVTSCGNCATGQTCNSGVCAASSNCMTVAQVQAERTMCLFIYNNAVYHYGNYGSSHHGHSCGSDVTNDMESSHASNPSHYLSPSYYLPICSSTCTAETNAAFCSRLGKNCASLTNTDNCGTSRTVSSCGSCQTGQTCTSGVCTNPTCTPTTYTPALSTFCGSKTVVDNCGSSVSKTGTLICSTGYTCTNNVCQGSSCTAETNAAFCSRLGKNCGSVTNTDNCGTARTISCGSCQTGQTCTNNVCVSSCTVSSYTPALNTFCGSRSVTTNCGTTVTMSGTLSCTTGQSCTNNVCTGSSCTPSCSGKTCGSDGCSGSCGSCGTGQTCNSNGVCVAFSGTVYYVSTNGNDGNTGTSSSPWKTLAHACSSAGSGSIIHVNAGTYAESSACNLPVGVSIEGEGASSNIVSSVGSGNNGEFSNVYTIMLKSSSMNTNGNQHISNIKLDGNSFKAWGAIGVLNRGNVEISGVTIQNFNVMGVGFDNSEQTSSFATGNKIHDSTIINSAGYYGGGSQANLKVIAQNGLLIYNNVITVSGDANGRLSGDPIYGVEGYIKNMKIYGNTITKTFVAGFSKWDFAIEIWNTYEGNEIYNNNIIGSVDLCWGHGGSPYSVYVHDNVIGQNALLASENTRGVDLEGYNSDIIIERNLIKNTAFGINSNVEYGASSDHGADADQSNIKIDYNIMYNIGELGVNSKGWGIWYGFGENAGTSVTNLQILNNVIVGAGSGSGTTMYGIGLPYQNPSNVQIKNNIITNFDSQCIQSQGSVSGLSIQNNIFYGNGNNAPAGSGTISNNLVSNPLFASSSDFHLQSGSPAINAGVNVGLSLDKDKRAVSNPPEIGAYEY